MASMCIESQTLLSGKYKGRLKKRIWISIFVIVLLLTVTLIPTFVYLHFKNKDKTKNSKVVIDEDIPLPDGIDLVDPIIPKQEDLIEQPHLTPNNKVLDPVDIKPVNVKPEVIVPEVTTTKNLRKLSYREIYDKLKKLTIESITAIAPGSYKECLSGSCRVKGPFILDWKLKMVAEFLSELETPDVEEEFKTMMEYEDHISIYGMYYDSEQKYKYSFKLYGKNKEIVKAHNKNPDRLYNMKLNHFAAFSDDDEIMKQYNINVPIVITKSSKNTKKLTDQVIHIDWRDKGYVTEVIHQKGCGSCWAISAVDVFNSYRAIKGDELKNYSFQQLIDCVSEDYDCKYGGDHLDALKYIKDNNMCLNSEYEYIYKKIHCSENMCRTPTKINKIVDINEESALEHLKNNGPFLTSFDTNTRFVLYDDGIYDGNCEFGNGHSIVVVGHGYDKIKKVNYWIVKNSWGKDWGEDGYYRIIDSNMIEDGRKVNTCKFLDRCYGIK